ncbi:uncharacterized protein METZ01_LOCUS358526 [marine metagenome]|uniref:DUF5683 domain-containing protein n=1 Tax=marine metagenome TaxID=408172 RepID=A0A382S7X6_9ZZZZ
MKGIWSGICMFIGIMAVPEESFGQPDSVVVAKRPAIVESLHLPSPTGALLRSTALPGWGQFYNRKPLKGGLFLILQAGLFTGVLLQRDQPRSGGLTPLGNTMLLGLIGVRVFSIADAYVDAHFADFDDLTGRSTGVALGVGVKW